MIVCYLAEREQFVQIKAIQDKHWRKAMEEKLTALQKNKNWTLVELPPGEML